MLFKWVLSGVTITTTVEDSETPGELEFEGPSKGLVDMLTEATGPFGHKILVDGYARPSDVTFALDLAGVDYELASGKIIEYESAPEGAVS